MSTRRSQQNMLIRRIIKETKIHPSADWVYGEVRKEMPNISLGTVYRNLRLLEEKGEILELDFGRFSRFDGNCQNHYHFKCQRCGKIFDLDMPVNKELDQQVAQKTGFTVFQHRLEFRGLCKEC